MLTSTVQPRLRDTHCAELEMLGFRTEKVRMASGAYVDASAVYRYTTSVAVKEGALLTVERARTS